MLGRFAKFRGVMMFAEFSWMGGGGNVCGVYCKGGGILLRHYCSGLSLFKLKAI